MVRQDTKVQDQNKKLFIGGLNPKTDENALRNYYGQWGEIIDAVVMRDPKSGRSRGFGFITYQDSNSVDLAQTNRPHELDGKTVDSKRAMPREDSTPETHASVKKIFVGGLMKGITNEDLQNYFSQFGRITECQIVVSKETGESRGFGFISFDDADAVDKVILGKPHQIGNSKADVKKALSKEEMRNLKPKSIGRGGFGGGPGNYGAPYGGFQSQGGYGGGGFGNYGGGATGGYQDYNSSYGNAGYGGGFGNGASNYGASGGGNWNQGGMGDGGFGSYGQQSYGGGPMRGGNQYGNTRQGPYSAE